MVIATIVASGVAYRILSPPLSEQFYAMWILGSNGLAEHYYPGDNPNIALGEAVNWTLGVYNHMGSLQYVVVRVKLLNSTLTSPDDSTGRASPVQPLFEFTRVLTDNETWSLPFAWKILDVTLKGGTASITNLSVNQIPFNSENITAVSGFNFRFVFELWSYDKNMNDLVFSRQAGGTQHSVWTQIWFNTTAT